MLCSGIAGHVRHHCLVHVDLGCMTAQGARRPRARSPHVHGSSIWLRRRCTPEVATLMGYPPAGHVRRPSCGSMYRMRSMMSMSMSSASLLCAAVAVFPTALTASQSLDLCRH